MKRQNHSTMASRKRVFPRERNCDHYKSILYRVINMTKELNSSSTTTHSQYSLVRDRFNSFLPRYRTLWITMIKNTLPKEETQQQQQQQQQQQHQSKAKQQR